MKKAEIGIIGGSGFYDLAANLREMKVETPYGSPSDKIALGEIAGREVAFLPRHGKTHDIPPHKINYRANIWALKSLGISRILTSHAVGSLQKKIRPGDFIILDQFIDRTKDRADTFYDGQIATHISTAFPYCPQLRNLAIKIAGRMKLPLWFTQMGWEAVNMTEYPEVVLAREKEICYCAIAVATDYDAGLVAGGEIRPVSVEKVVSGFKKNIQKAKEIVLKMLENWPEKVSCDCQRALESARF